MSSLLNFDAVTAASGDQLHARRYARERGSRRRHQDDEDGVGITSHNGEIAPGTPFGDRTGTTQSLLSVVGLIYELLNFIERLHGSMDSGHERVMAVCDQAMTHPHVLPTPSNRKLGRVGMKAKVRRVAIELFKGDGYETVLVQQIICAAGVSKGAFYNLYPSKAGVLADVLEEIDEALATLVSRMVPGQLRSSMRFLTEGVDKVLSPYKRLGPNLAAEVARRPRFARLGLRPSAKDPTGFSVALDDKLNPFPHPTTTDEVGRILAELWVAALMDWMRQPEQSFVDRFSETYRLLCNFTLGESW